MSKVHVNRWRCDMRMVVVTGAALCAVGLAGCASSHDGRPSGSHAGPAAIESTAAVSSKPDIARMSEMLVVERDSFPDLPGADWRAPYMVETSLSLDPSAPGVHCVPMLNLIPRAEDAAARASLKKGGGDEAFRVDLTLPAEGLPNWQDLSGKCGSIDEGNRQWVVTPRSVDGLPAWAVASDIELDDGQGDKPGLSIVGNYRGLVIYLQVHNRSTGIADADLISSVKLFNDQVAKLEAAPA